MNIPQDPVMLMSFVNMKLRDEYGSLKELCQSLSLNENELIKTLKSAGFDYLPDQNQFR